MPGCNTECVSEPRCCRSRPATHAISCSLTPPFLSAQRSLFTLRTTDNTTTVSTAGATDWPCRTLKVNARQVWSLLLPEQAFV